MGYKIKYGNATQKTKITYTSSHYFRIALVALTSLVIIFAILSVGKDTLRTYFIPGNPDVTQAAFSQMITDLSNGESLGDAFVVFCKEIIQSAKLT